MPSNIREMMEALREAIGKATPGEWQAEPLGGKGAWIKSRTTDEWTAMSCGDSHASASYNAQYIALANPQTLTILLQHVERLERALEPFVADKLPSNRRSEIDFDGSGLRRIISPMELARLAALRALNGGAS
jgi:hypothetical protein